MSEANEATCHALSEQHCSCRKPNDRVAACGITFLKFTLLISSIDQHLDPGGHRRPDLEANKFTALAPCTSEVAALQP
jgi:hypothetical protein